jgi:hypothetical protein
MKRILLLLTVVALMVVMLAMAVGPAFAQGDQRFNACFAPGASTHIWFCQA